MIVSFDGEKMRAVSIRENVAADQLGIAAAVAFHATLAEIEAAATAAEVMDYYGIAAMPVGEEALAVTFGPGLCARFRIVPERGAFDAQGAPVWSEVRRLKLTGVEVHGRAI